MALARFRGRFRDAPGRAGRRRRSRSHPGAPPASDAPAPADRRQRRRRYISVGLGASLLAVIFGVALFGYYREFYRPPRIWAGSVNNVEFNMGDLVQRIRVLQGVNRYQGGRVDLSTVPFEYLQNLINAEILRQEAPRLGIQPTDELIDAALRRQFQPDAPEGQETDPGQLDQEFQNNYQTFLTATGLTDGEYRVILEEDLTRAGLAATLAQEVASPQPQVEVRWIRLPIDPAETGSGDLQPDQVAQRLEVEDFAAVAREVSRSAGYADPTGYVGWVPKGAFPNLDPLLYGDAELGTAALKPGETSRPFYARDGIFIVEVLSGPEERELNDRIGIKLTLELANGWQDAALQQGTANGTVKMNFNSRLYDWVADQVQLTAPRLPATSAQPVVR